MSFLSNPLIVGGIVAAVGAVAVGGTYLYAKQGTPAGGRKEVVLLRPGVRGLIVPVTKETAKSLECKKTEGVTRKFYKFGRGWVFPKDTKFLAVDGNAYTKIIDTPESVKISVPDYLRFLWGDIAYDSERFPKVLRDAIEKTIVGITITPDKIGDDDKGLPPVNAEDVNDEKKEKLVGYVTKAIKDEGKMDWKTMFMGVSIGLVVGIMLVSFKVIKLA
jgi:hypothetical protein